MEVLPAIVGNGPVIVFCGMAGAESTKSRDHYYASPGNSFWESAHLSGLTPHRLRPEEDAQVVEHGLGLTDLVGHWDHDENRGWVEIDRLIAQVEEWEPAFVAFTAKGTAGHAAKALGHRAPGLGLAELGDRPVGGVRAAGHERRQPPQGLRRATDAPRLVAGAGDGRGAGAGLPQAVARQARATRRITGPPPEGRACTAPCCSSYEISGEHGLRRAEVGGVGLDGGGQWLLGDEGQQDRGDDRAAAPGRGRPGSARRRRR